MDLNNAPATGRLYSLAQLLGGELALMIPAIQRDYCWGLPGSTKVTSFVKGILHLYINDRETPLGLLYGYESPAGSGHIHIIDGQQRLTTLYLLCGMLYRRTPTAALRRLLISDYQLIDAREPRLLYQARADARSFMSDLVINFFLNRDGRLSQLEQCPWYFTAYDADPSVRSFIGALRMIDSALEEADLDPEWDFDAFAWFVTNRLPFLYYDLGSRRNAEEVFVTLNTTGEPLTPAQVLKSRLCASGLCDERWEEMERWFWLHRPRREGLTATADDGLDRFIALWTVATGLEPSSLADAAAYDGLMRFFGTFSRLCGAVGAEAAAADISLPETLFTLLPSLAYIARWEPDGLDDADIRRFHCFLATMLRYRRPAQGGADTRAALTLVGEMPSADILSLAALPRSEASARILGDEERARLAALAAGSDRDRAEAVVHRAVAHPLFGGRVMRLVQWASDGDGTVDIDRLEDLTDAVYTVFGTGIDRSPDLDDLRRALLSVRHPGYPMVRRGDTVLSLCWTAVDWQRLLQQAPGLLRFVLERVISRDCDPRDTLREMASRAAADRSHPWSFLLLNPALIAGCRHRQLMRPCPNLLGLCADEPGDVRWFADQSSVKVDLSRWQPLRPDGSRCLATSHRRLDIRLELACAPSDTGASYTVAVCNTPGRQGLIHADLSRQPLPPAFRRDRDRHVATFPSASPALAAFHTLARLF